MSASVRLRAAVVLAALLLRRHADRRSDAAFADHRRTDQPDHQPDADRSKLPGVMPQEVRDTVRLYLDGKIQQWFGRADGRGVMFILNVGTVAEAKALMDALPLANAGLATFEYTPLTPLTPLRLLPY